MLWGFQFTFLCILNLCLQIETCGDHNGCEAGHNDRQYQGQDKVIYVSLSVGQLGCGQHGDDTCAVMAVYPDRWKTLQPDDVTEVQEYLLR